MHAGRRSLKKTDFAAPLGHRRVLTSPWRGHSGWPAIDGLNVTMIVLATIYATVIVAEVFSGRLFHTVGDDFRAYWSAAEIAHSSGLAQAFELDRLARAEAEFLRTYGAPEMMSEDEPWPPPYLVPVPYLPAFVAMFQPLLFLDPRIGFLAWTLVNAITLVAYLMWFLRSTAPGTSQRFLISIALCFPVLDTLRWGQVNVLLMIFLAEFLRCCIRGADLRSGLWLGALLLKPQTLLLLLPGLVLARRWRTLCGFAVTGSGVIGLSLAAGGLDALISNVRLVLLYPTDITSTGPGMMANWRAAGFHLANLLPSQVVWPLAMLGMIGTAALGIGLWWGKGRESPTGIALVVLGSYAATCAVAWHSVMNMALPLAAPIAYLAAQKVLPTRIVAL